MNATQTSTAVIIQIPSALRRFTEGRREIAVEATTVGAALEQLTRQYPALREHLFTPEGTLRAFVNVYVKDTNIRQLEGLETTLKPGTRLVLVPSIAGGIPN